jgi:NAD(P)-dependent dehydrogenase (short-subunit alcohol dehydrogenase family)
VSRRLENRVAVVTGASGVIGRAVAHALAEAGAHVALVARTAESLRETELALRDYASSVSSWPADVRALEQLTQVREDVVARAGSIDTLVNLAGGNIPAATLADDASPLDLDLGAFREVLELNLVGSVSAIIAFGPALVASAAEERTIVNVSSASATRALTRVGGYGAAKAGVESITRWFAVEFARRNIPIRVNAIAPGFVLGVQNRSLLLDAAGDPTERATKIVAQTPMGRFGSADEIADAVTWLCSRESRFVTGAVIPVDGGFGAFSGV